MLGGFCIILPGVNTPLSLICFAWYLGFLLSLSGMGWRFGLRVDWAGGVYIDTGGVNKSLHLDLE